MSKRSGSKQGKQSRIHSAGRATGSSAAYPMIESLEPRLLLSGVDQLAGIGYLLSDGGTEFQQYDITNQQWLTPITLEGSPGGATASLVDSDGIYVAYNQNVVRYELDGSNPTHLFNASNSVHAIHSDGNLLFLNHSSGIYARLISIDKNTNTIIDTMSNYVDSVYGSSISVTANKIFGQREGISPSDITYASYDDSGNFGDAGNSPYHGDYLTGSETWVFPLGTKVVDNSGGIYATANLTRLGSFDTKIDDIAFSGDDIPIVLKDNVLTAYSSVILPTGSKALSANATQILVNSTNVIAFNPDAANPNGYTTQIVPLADLEAPQPGQPVNPVGLAYKPDHIEIAGDGTLLLFDKETQSIFRWDPQTQAYSETIPLIDVPSYMAYSSVTDTVYLAYASGLINSMDLGAETPAEQPFAILPGGPCGLATAGQYVFADGGTHYTFAPDGTMISAAGRYHSSEYIWSDVNSRMYFFRDGISPNDLYYQAINGNGEIGESKESPLHDSTGFRHPIRVSPDGEIVILGSGVVHDAITLERQTGGLANSVADITWMQGTVYTVRDVSGYAQFQQWTGATFALGKVAQVEGKAVGLFTIADSELVGIYIGSDGVPQFRVMDANFQIDSLAIAATDAGKLEGDSGATPFTFTVTRVGPTSTIGSATVNWAVSGSGVNSADDADFLGGLLPSGTVSFADGEVSKTITVNVNADTDIELDESFTVTLSEASGGAVIATPTAEATIINDDGILTVSLPTSATEGDGVLVGQGQITIFSPREKDLIVSLVNSDPSEITVPETVTIPAGQTSVTFDIGIVDDSELDLTQPAVVTASADGHVPDSALLQVVDNETAALTVTLPASATEGDGVLAGQGTVTVSVAPTVDVVVNLSSSDASELTVPGSVTIPAGQTSATFNLSIQNDTLIDGKQTASVTAHVNGWTDGSASMDILEGTRLTVTLPASAKEGDSPLTSSCRVNIPFSISTDVVVSLSSSDTSEATVPATVTIRAGQKSSTFTLTIVNDTLLDGTQPVVITAFSDGIISGEGTIQITDNEVVIPSVILPDNVNETDGVLVGQGTVKIDKSASSDLTVELSSSDTTELIVPPTVVIPAGQTSATFDLSVQNDSVWDPSRSVSVTARIGTRSASDSTNVIDTIPPVITITLPVDASENDGVLQNQGQLIISKSPVQTQTLTLSSSNTDLLLVPSTVTINAGNTSVYFNITLHNDFQSDGDNTVIMTAVGFNNLSTGQAEILVHDAEPTMDQYLIHPSAYNVGNYWNYDLFFTEVNERDVRRYNVHGSLSEKVTRNVVFNGQDAFELVQNLNALGEKSTYTETRCLTDGFVRLLQNKSSTGTDLYTNPQELYWLGIPGSSYGTVGDGGVFDGNHTETRTYFSYGLQTVTVPAGTFNCYVIEISETETAPEETTEYTKEIIYFNPYIGIVKNDVYINTGSNRGRFTQSLTKTNICLPGDLTAVVLAPTNANNLVSGDTVRIPIRVTNNGTNISSGKMDIQVFVKDSQQILHTDTPAVVLKNVAVNLKPGASATYYANVQLPLGVAGQLYCIAKIDPANTIIETNEANNIAVLANPMNVRLGFVDLVGRLGLVKLPGAVVAGQRLLGNVQVQVLNAGNVVLGPQARANIAVFARNTNTGEQIALGQLKNVSLAKLAANGARANAFTVAVNLPAGLPKGDYEIQAQITPVSGVGETDLTNNLAAGLAGGQTVGVTSADPFIDLVAGVDAKLAANAKYALPANVVSGNSQKLYVPITVTNAGNISTTRTQWINVNLYARNAAGEDTLLAALQRQSVANLAPGKTKLIFAQTTFPPGLATGQYTIVAEIDFANVVAESDETNNTAALPRTINIQEGFVDLAPTITKVTAPNPAQPGNKIAVVVQVKNRGNLLCKGKVNLNLEVVGNDQATLLFALNNQAVALAPGGAKAFTLTAILPYTLQNGDYSLRLTVEPVAGVLEGGIFGATNNTTTSLNVFTFNNPGDKEWVQQFSMSSSKESYTSANSMALDAMGNVYVAFAGQDNIDSSAVDYLRKYDSTGRIVWTRQQVNCCYSASISVDNEGNVYFGGVQMTAYGDKGFLKKYNSGGTLLWTRVFENIPIINSIAVDNSGNVYVGGWTAEKVTSANPQALLVAFNPNGRKLWEQRIGTKSTNYINSIAVDINNNIYIAGATGEVIKYDKDGCQLWSRRQGGNVVDVSVDMEGNVYLGGTVSRGNSQYYAYWTKYDSVGNKIWTKTVDVTDRVFCGAVDVDHEGNIFFIYNIRNVYTGPVSDGIYLCKYDSQGNLGWTRSIGGVAYDQYCCDMILDGHGYAYVAGTIHGTIGQESFGLYDAFLLKVDVCDTPDPSQPTAPDLTVHIGDPADGKPVASGWARIDVKNEGDALAKGAVDIELWCTSDGVIDGSAGDYLLKTLTDQTLLLLPGEIQYFWANYELPAEINPADVELIARVDTGYAIQESNEDNNFGILASNWGSADSES